MSEQPPTFQVPNAPPARKSSRTLWIIAACILIPCCGCLIAAGFYGFRIYKEFMPFVGCMGAAETVGQAVTAYANDHGGKLPNAATWQDDVAPYYSKALAGQELHELIKMSESSSWGCWDQSGQPMTGFAFNSKLSKKLVKDLKSPEELQIVFEVAETGKNLHQPYAVRNMGISPKIVFGQRRGWFEIDVTGRLSLLVQNDKTGGYRRVPVNSRSGKFGVGDEGGVEVKVSTGVEPGM